MKKERLLKGFLFGFVAAIAIGLIANKAIAQQVMMMQSGPVYVANGQVVATPNQIAGAIAKLEADIDEAIADGDDSGEKYEGWVEDLADLHDFLNYGVEYTLVDNFEYWNTPLAMGWVPQQPNYPVYGYGLGYGNVQTVLDFEEGSRVLDVYRPSSVFLMNTPYAIYTLGRLYLARVRCSST